MEYLTMLSWPLIVWAFIHLLHLLASRKSKLPPGPIPLPIVGSLFQIGSKPNESLTELAKIYGPLMTLRLGQVITVFVSSATMAKEVLLQNDQSLAGRNVVDAVRTGNFHESSIIWSQPNASWRKLRVMCNTQIFAMSRLAAKEGLRRKKVEELIAHMQEHCLTGREVDIGQAAFNTTLNLISNTLFSVDLVDPNSTSAQEFKDLVWGLSEEGARPNLVDYFPVLRPIDPQGIRRRMAGYFKKLCVIFDRMIDQRLSSRAGPSESLPRNNDVLDALLNLSEENGFELDIRPVLVDLFAAGSDTSSTTVEWAMAELLRNPHYMKKAQMELKETIGSGQQVEETDITRLPYLQAIVKETLRLHPPVPLFLRKTLTDVEVGGYMIPKNTGVTVNVWAIGRDPDVWVDPSSFLPERFLGSDIDFRGQYYEFIPFGSGRRICPGLPLAGRIVHLMLASLLHAFSWKLPDGMMPEDMDMSSKFGITLQMAAPLRAIPVLDG